MRHRIGVSCLTVSHAIVGLVLGTVVGRADDLGPWRDCLRASIMKLDDHRSDARTIAAAAVAACRSKRAAMIRERMLNAGLGAPHGDEIDKAIDANRDDDIDFASVIVLGLRR